MRNDILRKFLPLHNRSAKHLLYEATNLVSQGVLQWSFASRQLRASQLLLELVGEKYRLNQLQENGPYVGSEGLASLVDDTESRDGSL